MCIICYIIFPPWRPMNLRHFCYINTTYANAFKCKLNKQTYFFPPAVWCGGDFACLACASSQCPSLTPSLPSVSERLKRSVPGPRRWRRPRHGAVSHSALRLRHRLCCQCSRLPDERSESSNTLCPLYVGVFFFRITFLNHAFRNTFF